MSGFETIIGQNHPVRLLQTFLRDGTLPHAMLFSGLMGVGKRTTAKLVAMALNCHRRAQDPSNPCGQCKSCRPMQMDNHPDLLMIEPRGNLLRIDQIRKLLGMLSMRPFNADHRVVVIAEAQTMNAEASNALLKILEEPPLNTTLILTAGQKSDLLPTIVSRCRHIRFNPLSPDAIMAILHQIGEKADQYTNTAAILSGGSLTKARQLSMTVWQDRINWLIHAAGLAKRPERADARRSITRALAFSAQLAQKKEQVPELLETLAVWIRDLSILPYHSGLVVHQDRLDILMDVRAVVNDKCLLNMWTAVQKAQKDIAAKANLRLTLDVMALKMAGYTPPSCE